MARKKTRAAPEDSGADFMTLFTALSVILLAFFIMLTSIAVPDDSKKRKALGSLRGSFGILNGGMAFDDEGKYLERREALTDDIILFDRMVRDVEVTIQTRHLGLEGDVQFDRGGLYPRLMISSRVLYPEGGSALSPRTFALLDRVAETSNLLDRTLVVEGHTAAPAPDDDSAQGALWEVSAARALNIKRYLISADAMAPDRVEADGVAHFRPEPGQPPRDRIVIVFHERADRRADPPQGP